jgi:hypothetical protein
LPWQEPTIIFGGDGTPRDFEDADERLEIHSYIVKPVESEQLEKSLNQFLSIGPFANCRSATQMMDPHGH